MYLPTPPYKQDLTQGQDFKRNLNLEFPSSRLVGIPGLKSQACSAILPIAGGRIVGFISFPRETTSSRI